MNAYHKSGEEEFPAVQACGAAIAMAPRLDTVPRRCAWKFEATDNTPGDDGSGMIRVDGIGRDMPVTPSLRYQPGAGEPHSGRAGP